MHSGFSEATEVWICRNPPQDHRIDVARTSPSSSISMDSLFILFGGRKDEVKGISHKVLL